MGILTEDMKRVVRDQRLGYVATVCADGTPNLSPKGTTTVWDDESLIFADIVSPGTVANLRINPVLEINVVDPLVRKGYRFKGSATILTEGPLFEQALAFYRQRGTTIPIQSIVVMKVERALPLISPAYDADKTEEVVRNQWLHYWKALWNQQDLLEFALRLATFPDDPQTQNAQLLPGCIPDQLPAEIPLPEGCRVLGSLIRNPESINMLLDTHLSPEQVLAFYRQRMQAIGWQTAYRYRPNRGGFMSSGSRSRGGNETFYQNLRDPELPLGSSAAWDDDDNRNRSGPALTINAFRGRNNGTDVRLNLEMNSPFPPGPLRHMRRHPSRNIFSFLPALEAPEGAKLTSNGGGGSPDGAYSQATLETQHNLSTLAAHYKTQLEQAGCVITKEGQNGPIAWNSWTLQDDDERLHGFFTILKFFDQEYHLDVRMKSDKGDKATRDTTE